VLSARRIYFAVLSKWRPQSSSSSSVVAVSNSCLPELTSTRFFFSPRGG
jgi:hypothetical protein